MHIIPKPQFCELIDGVVCLSGNYRVLSKDERLFHASERLFSTFKCETGIDTTIDVNECEPREGYTLEICKSGVKICGNSNVGAFWGLQTLQQIVAEFGVNDIPCCRIEDSPAMVERGFYHDITRGKVPTLKTLKDLIDKLALLKINSLQLYVEHAFAFKEYEGIISSENQLTADEIRELDDYCYERFIDFVPSLSTFGHLYHLLNSDKYKHLCELEDYIPSEPWLLERMAHHTIDAYNPESIALIQSLIDQYIPLFRSKRFNICCDETFDLCMGRNKGKDKAEAYFSFLMKIIEYVQGKGKQVMMWGDILLNHPELFEKLPKNIVVLNWDYGAEPDEEKIAAIAKFDQKQVLCPGTSAWNFVVPWFDNAKKNITEMVRYAHKYNACGILNTNWGDYGNIGSLYSAYYPMSIGAAAAWNINTVIDSCFENGVALQIYGDSSGKTIDLLKQLTTCEAESPWATLCLWYARKREIPHKIEDLTARIEKCKILFDECTKMEEENKISKAMAVDIKMSCRTVSMILGILLCKLKGEECLPENFESWQKDFKSTWMYFNKESELSQIMNLIIEMKNYIVS